MPCAKIDGEEKYSIVSDYLGTPTHAYNAAGSLVWERELDIYGAVRKLKGEKCLIPQLYQGQYVDEETGLAYNRFRYYDNESGSYISQDPIGLWGGARLYGYVKDSNIWIDSLGLTGRGWLNWAKQWHDKRADEIFGEGKGKSVGGRNYDKSVDGKDIEYKSDNFGKGPRSQESLDRMNKQLDKDIANKIAGDANPHWHFEHDPSVADDMKDFLKKMDENDIPRTHGKTYPGHH